MTTPHTIPTDPVRRHLAAANRRRARRDNLLGCALLILGLPISCLVLTHLYLILLLNH